MKTLTIGAGEFKTHCLRYLDEVNEKQMTLIITKRGKMVAKLVPTKEEQHSLYGCLRGTVLIQGDIVSPSDEVWEAEYDK